MEDQFCESSFDDDFDAMEASFCGSSVTEEICSSGQKSSNMNFLDSNQNITEILEDDSVENMHDTSFSLILEESSSDEMSNIDSENRGIQNINIDNYPVSFDDCNINMDPFSKNSESLCELNTCSEVAEKMIEPQMSVAENNRGCISQSMSLNCDNLQVIVSCVKSPIPKLKNTYKEISNLEVGKTAPRSQTNLIAGSENMSFPTTASVKKMKLDNNTERTSFPVTSQFEEIVDTLVETNDTCGTSATVTEPNNMMEYDRMSEMSFEPYEESELIDLDLEFVPFGIPSPGECIKSQERTPISSHETQASILECPEQECDALKKERSPIRLTFDDQQEKGLLLTTGKNQNSQDLESVEDQKCEKVGCIKVDDHLVAKYRKVCNATKSLCCEDIPSMEYCLIDHNLNFIANGCKIRLQFDVEEFFFTCPFCSVTALNNETIGQHILNHTSDKELKCLLGCSDVFVTMKEVVDHLNSHKDNEVYRCGACQNTFPTVALIKSHVALLHKPDQFIKHTREHKIDKKYMCTKCGLSFDQENSLDLHNLTKCSSKSHSCRLCELCFQSASDLKKHAALHFTQRPYRCKLCHYAANNRCDLHFHLNQHRNNNRPYSCPECSVVCPNEARFMAHVLKLHCSGNLTCVCCRRSDFTDGHQLMVHMRAHEAHGWTETKVPGLRLMLSLQVRAAARREVYKNNDNNTITVTDCGGVRLHFTPDDYISGEEQDLVSFEVNIA